MVELAETAERVAATTKKLEKTALVADYLRARPAEEAAISALFLSGRPFPMREETTLNAGGALLWQQIKKISGKSDAQLEAAYRRHGDIGAVSAEVFPDGRPATLNVVEVERAFRQIAGARGVAAKTAALGELLARATRLEAKYLVKIMTGDLRIGLKESLVEGAIARAYGQSSAEVERANMLLGDIAETVRLAAAGRLGEAKMRLFHPLGFMLASPVESAEEALAYFKDPYIEHKYDGIRAQAHVSAGQVRLFSRTRDEITESFPELGEALATLAQEAILDGEIVAWSYPEKGAPQQGRAMPFSALQQRLGRKKVSQELMRQVPVAYLAFDMLYAGGNLLIDRPLAERARLVDELLAAPRSKILGISSCEALGSQSHLAFDPDVQPLAAQLIRAPVYRASRSEQLDELFMAAKERGNEGLMIKDPNSVYTPGRRGKAWLKMKRELATLDAVVTAVEYGHGKRIGVLSDYTFAVWDGERLVNIGKAYSGLTDAEIAEMTNWFVEHTTAARGLRLDVEPKIVIEVAFNNMMRSGRHNSGYALRFPRIVRLRPDKRPEEADTLARVKDIYQRQHRAAS
ncbi:MAG: ATP-dependent DNA ligase [Acidobacteria bacterium]|nr:ATP-dependent DNA ligase [Acidobacteriota bacterium]